MFLTSITVQAIPNAYHRILHYPQIPHLRWKFDKTPKSPQIVKFTQSNAQQVRTHILYTNTRFIWNLLLKYVICIMYYRVRSHRQMLALLYLFAEWRIVHVFICTLENIANICAIHRFNHLAYMLYLCDMRASLFFGILK